MAKILRLLYQHRWIRNITQSWYGAPLVSLFSPSALMKHWQINKFNLRFQPHNPKPEPIDTRPTNLTCDNYLNTLTQKPKSNRQRVYPTVANVCTNSHDRSGAPQIQFRNQNPEP